MSKVVDGCTWAALICATVGSYVPQAAAAMLVLTALAAGVAAGLTLRASFKGSASE